MVSGVWSFSRGKAEQGISYAGAAIVGSAMRERSRRANGQAGKTISRSEPLVALFATGGWDRFSLRYQARRRSSLATTAKRDLNRRSGAAGFFPCAGAGPGTNGKKGGSIPDWLSVLEANAFVKTEAWSFSRAQFAGTRATGKTRVGTLTGRKSRGLFLCMRSAPRRLLKTAINERRAAFCRSWCKPPWRDVRHLGSRRSG